jgi:biotin carboxyl carrier protein
MIHRFSVEIAGSEQELAVEKLEGNRVRITRGGQSRVYDAIRVAGAGRATTWSLLPEGGGRAALIDVDGNGTGELTVTVDNASVPIKLVAARAKLAGRAAAPPKSGPQAVQSPMPGKVVKVLCAAGDEVKSGQGVIVVEAMKMENELKVPRDGKVKSIAVKEGQAVEAGQTLVTLE